MRVSRRALLLLTVVCLTAAACTAGEEAAPPAASPAPAPAAASPGVGAATTASGEPATMAAVLDAGPSVAAPEAAEGPSDEELEALAQEWIDNESGLSDMLREEIVLDSISRGGGLAHLTYVQQHFDVSVRGAQFIVHVRADGSVIGASTSLSTTLPGEGATEELTEAEALDVASKAVPGEVDGEPTVEATWLEVGDQLRLGWQVFLTTREPVGAYAIVVDATDGEVLSVDLAAVEAQAAPRDKGEEPSAVQSAEPSAVQSTEPEALEVAQAGAASCDLPATPAACVFPVDPLYGSGQPEVDPEEANEFLVGVGLQNLTDSGSGELVGSFAQVAAPLLEDYVETDGTWGTDGRGSASFEGAMTYFWVDYTQRLLQSYGFQIHADDPVDLVPLDPTIEDNAFYLFVEDRIHMGAGSDGRNEAEDASGIIHEYGHGLLQAAVPFINSSEGGAFHEGFADLVAYLTTMEFRNGDSACLFAWVDDRCLRRLDLDLVYPDDLAFEPHLDAQIFTAAVWDVLEGRVAADGLSLEDDCADFQANPCGPARDEVFATLLASLSFLTPQLTLNDAAAAFLLADAEMFGGENADLIRESFAAHGLDVDASPSIQIGGSESGGAPTAGEPAVSLFITHTYRGDLDVSLEVIDAAGEQLCSASIASPTPGDSEPDLKGVYPVGGTPCAEHLPPGPDQQWVLRVADTAAEDLGEVVQFSVFDGENDHPAPGLPVPIPDADSEGITVAVGADDGGGVEEGTEVIEGDPSTMTPGPGGGTLTMGLRLTHPYVGDLQIVVGAVDAESETVLCSVLIRSPDPQDSSANVRGTADVSECSGFFPPTPAQPWVVSVVDTAAIDEGTIDLFGLLGPDGSEFFAQGPVPIPDDDPTGAILAIDG